VTQPDLSRYQIIVVNSSAGKDSQAMLDYVVEQADAAGVRDRIVVVHADLGRIEWPGTRELAERQAQHYGVRFEVVRRKGSDLLGRIEERGMFPDARNRWCTSDFKRTPVSTVITRLVAEQPRSFTWVLNCMGLRADESSARAKKLPFENDARLSNGRRRVDTWLPIHDWVEARVWWRIRQSGVPHHPAYDQGMPRLSCSFCVLASRSALVRAAQLRPDLAAEYAAVEDRTGHLFRKDLSIQAVIEEAAGADVTTVQPWAA